MMKRKTRAGLIILVCLAFLLFAGCNNQADFYVEGQESGDVPPEDEQTQTSEEGTAETGPSEINEKETELSAAEKDAQEHEAEAENTVIYVQVCGAVAVPGVYALKSGSRLFEAIEMAGGLLPEANLSSVNQAQALTDGQMVYVCAQGEETAPVPGENARETEEKDGRVNINTASAEELMNLPGIGKAKAESIVSYRDTKGAFQSPEDIMNIEGIKEGVYTKIKDQIKID